MPKYAGTKKAAKSSPLVLIGVIVLLHILMIVILWEYIPQEASNFLESTKASNFFGKAIAILIPSLGVWYTLVSVFNFNDTQKGNGAMSVILLICIEALLLVLFWQYSDHVWEVRWLKENTMHDKIPMLTPGGEIAKRSEVIIIFLWTGIVLVGTSVLTQFNLLLSLAGKLDFKVSLPKMKRKPKSPKYSSRKSREEFDSPTPRPTPKVKPDFASKKRQQNNLQDFNSHTIIVEDD